MIIISSKSVYVICAHACVYDSLPLNLEFANATRLAALGKPRDLVFVPQC